MMLLLGTTTLFAGLFLALRTLLQPKHVSRLVPARPAPAPAFGRGLSELAKRAGDAAEGALDQHGRKRPLEMLLEQAAVNMTAGEATVLAACLIAVSLLLGVMLGGPLLGALLVVLALVAGSVVLRRRRDARRVAFAEQLPDLLQLLSGNLRVGYGLLQAIETATRETEAPTSDELRRTTGEVRLGRDLIEALTGMAERLDNEDFGWIVQAIAINREVGGDLAEVLDSVAETIRARAHLARQVSALSAEGRLSAYVLFAMPLGIGAFISITNRPYVSVLFTTGLGLTMVVTGGILMTLGGLWLRRLIRPVF